MSYFLEWLWRHWRMQNMSKGYLCFIDELFFWLVYIRMASSWHSLVCPIRKLQKKTVCNIIECQSLENEALMQLSIIYSEYSSFESAVRALPSWNVNYSCIFYTSKLPLKGSAFVPQSKSIYYILWIRWMETKNGH